MVSVFIARDVYGQDRIAQVIAYLTAAYVLGPMVAPPIGGQLTAVSGWRSESYSYDATGNRTMSGYQTGTGNRLLADGYVGHARAYIEEGR